MNDTAAISSSDLRKRLRVDPNAVTVNYQGFTFREIFARLPSGIIADDLKEPEIWKNVQLSNKALRKFDRVIIVSFDETWLAEAYVENATGEMALLAKPRIVSFSERTEKLFSDGTYSVRWNGTGYDVIRLRDEAKMTDTFANAALAERALANLYPRRA
ncbi:hypothetical protein ELH55_01465 [Rhizobium ruizarguesonis]|jgi:hypothetical protein|uniref:hypothetical protein n=1 Tax=Rhizobium ruizarguesonis TaxID=2081791 RepID=UPI001030EA93|nr:hypothetical protein [Rhizobium ruizarguesonis]TBB05131.1 hypothetical protein ELH55_01465 [Rhizobium ruizarguesonis]